VTKVEQALQNVSHLALDTASVIYFVEAHPKYDQTI